MMSIVSTHAITVTRALVSQMFLYISYSNYNAFFSTLEQLIDCINMTRDLIKTRLKEPHKIPQDKKMIDLVDELIKQKLSEYFFSTPTLYHC